MTTPHVDLEGLLQDDAADALPPPDELDIEPCSPECPLPAAQQLWPAWRGLDAWRERVDAELPGDMSRLLPELWQLWRGLDLPEETPAADAGPLDAAVDDRLSDDGLALVLDDMYRAVFALGAAWAQSRTPPPAEPQAD